MGKAEQLAQQILDTSQTLIACAENADIEGFTQGQETRNRLISELNGLLGEVEDADFIRDALNQSKALNTELAASFKGEQQKLLNQKSELVKGQAMKSAYKAID